MTLLKTCCGCGSLRTGTVVAGVGAIIIAIIGIITAAMHLLVYRMGFLDAWIPRWIMQILVIINFTMTIIISLLLLWGTYKRNMYFMLPWVLLGIMVIIGLFISVIYTSVVCYIDHKNLEGSLWLVFGIITVVIYLYFWAVVYSFFCIIREENQRGGYMKDPFRRYYQHEYN